MNAFGVIKPAVKGGNTYRQMLLRMLAQCTSGPHVNMATHISAPVYHLVQNINVDQRPQQALSSGPLLTAFESSTRLVKAQSFILTMTQSTWQTQKMEHMAFIHGVEKVEASQVLKQVHASQLPHTRQLNERAQHRVNTMSTPPYICSVLTICAARSIGTSAQVQKHHCSAQCTCKWWC